MRPITLLLALAAGLFVAPPAAAAASWRWPVEGRVITPYSNGADPYAGGQHRGIDIAAPSGAPVVAASGGAVTFAGGLGSSGLVVAVRTGDGRFDTSYLHLSSIRVLAGDRVAAGDQLGAVGTTGRRSAAEPHLHFGVREAGSRFAYRDPLDFLPPPPAAPRTAPRGVPVPVAAPAEPRAAPLPGLPATVFAPLAALAEPVVAAAREAHLGTAGDVAAKLPHPQGSTGAPARAGRSRVPSGRPGPVAGSDGYPAAGRHAVAPGSAGERRGGVTAPLPAAGPAGHVATRAHPRAAPPAARASGRRPTGSTPGGRIDLGWLAACVAMVAAAALLGRPAGAAHSLRRAFELAPARPGGRGSRQ